MCSATEYVYLTTAQTDKPEYNAPYYNIPLLGSRFLPNPVILPENFHKEPAKESLLPPPPEPKQTPSTLTTQDIKRPTSTITEKKVSTYKSGKLRPYSCDECGKTFLMKHHLTTHARTHTGEKPHSCMYCGKSFTHKHCLNTHLLLHSKQRPYHCVTCKKNFTLKHHLLTHMKVILRIGFVNGFNCGFIRCIAGSNRLGVQSVIEHFLQKGILLLIANTMQERDHLFVQNVENRLHKRIIL